MSQPFSTSSPVTLPSIETWYVGRCFFYLKDPAAALASGYDRIRIYKRLKPADPWVELTKPDTQLHIAADKVNYTFLEQKAARGSEYRPSLSSSLGVLPDVPQDGLIQDAVDTSFETLWTSQEVRDTFAWGLLGLGTDDSGNPFPERFYAHYLKYGVTKFETKTRIRVLPTPIVGERHDYCPTEWTDRYWTFMLDEFPCVSVDKVTFQLPGSQPFVFPESWVQADLALGIVAIVPDGSAPWVIPTTFRTPVGFPKVTPGAIKIDYVAGFPLGRVPENIRDIIGKEAISGFLNLAGDLVGGAAIASQSMSMDGLSQSVNTTSSPTMGGFGARLIQYNNELKRDYPLVQALYKGPRLYVG
jgi:hypothetical protein